MNYKYNYANRHSNGYIPINYAQYNQNDTRLAGGFLGPFVLGGLTGGLVAPFFYNNNNNNRPVYYYPPQYYYPYRP